MKLRFKTNYKSIENIDSINLPKFTVLTGANGSGKSQLLEAIKNGSIEVESIESSEISLFNYESYRLNNENQYVKDDVLFHVINNAPIAPTVINPEDPSYSDEQVSIFFDVLRTKDYGRFADYKKENITEFRLYRQEENEDSYTLVKTIDATDYNSLRMPCKTQISV